MYTLVLNGILLFVILFYIYPLKSLFTFLMNQWFGLGGGAAPVLGRADTPTLMLVYSFGFVAIFSVLALLYLHTWRCRVQLDLDLLETAHTRIGLEAHLLYVAVALVALVSLVIVVLGGVALAAFSGLVYALIGPIRFVHGLVRGREIDRLRAARDGG